jgi:hypothetical protein
MENIENMTQDDVLDIINNFPVKPLGRRLIVTLNMEEIDGNMILSNTELAESQYVIAVGTHVTDIQAGSKVLLDLEKLMEYVPSKDDVYEKIAKIKIKPIEVNNRMFALINENIVDAIDNR